MDKAVAVKYSSALPAPMIIAKGKGELANKIIEIANRYDIKLVKDEYLADGLITLDIDAFIPEEFYEIMANILIFVRKLG